MTISIIGAGGHTRSLINLLEQKFLKINGIYDDNFSLNEKEIINGYPLLGKKSDCQLGNPIVLSIGNNVEREQEFRRLKGMVFKENLIHNTAFIENKVDMGLANQIFAHVYINSNVKIGDNNIINTGAVIEHETQIGSHNHISVHATLCGRVCIGNSCFIGAGATVIDKIKIGNGVILGANSVATKDILEQGTYIGQPARKVA